LIDKERLEKLFKKTMAFYSQATGYRFPLKPTLKTFADHEEFMEYLRKPAFRSGAVETCAGACLSVRKDKAEIAFDLTDDAPYQMFMLPWSLFHEYAHLKRRIPAGENRLHLILGSKALAKEEAEVCMEAFKLTEAFLRIKIPAFIHNRVKEHLAKEVAGKSDEAAETC
jgi:hypothetical protein